MLEGHGETLDCFDIAIRELSDKTIQAKLLSQFQYLFVW